jgi:hypothetical protein
MEYNIDQLKIIEKYEDFVNYIYPICINIPKGGHMTLRNKITECIFNQIELFIQAGKSNQISKLYLADSGISLLKFYLRFISNPSRKIISQNQYKVASLHLYEVETLLIEWIKSMKSQKE